MEIISMSARVLEDLAQRTEIIEKRAEKLRDSQQDLRLKRWLDGQDVCDVLSISKRTLQSYRDSGLLPFSIIKHKIFFRPEDVEKILKNTHHNE